jgi:hypothetical protein
MFGWLTLIAGPVPVIFIIALVIGIIAGSHGEALFSTMITWIGGITIAVLGASVIFAGIMDSDQSLLAWFIFVFLYSVRGFYTFTYEGNVVEVLVAGLVYFIVMLIITPILYLLSFAFAPLGVVIGKFIRAGISGRSSSPSPITSETPLIQSTPVMEEFVDDEINEFDESES